MKDQITEIVIEKADINSKEAGKAVGCGASIEISQDTAEIKRMYARKKSSGIGKRILSYLEAKAKENGFRRIILETRKSKLFINQRR